MRRVLDLYDHPLADGRVICAGQFGPVNLRPCAGRAWRPFSASLSRSRRLEAASLFVVPLDRQRRWYRYHALFREFLLGELGRTEPAIIATLHQKAASWYEASGSPAPAVEHLLQTTDTDRTVRLVTRLAQGTYAAGQMSTLQRWLRAIGDANIERYPPLAVQRWWVSLATGDTTGRSGGRRS
jgi:LuxR family transcriptional regulator, maltose regulon positive regulatory protein